MKVYVALGGYAMGDREVLGVRRSPKAAMALCAEEANSLGETRPFLNVWDERPAVSVARTSLRRWISVGDRNLAFEVHEFEIRPWWRRIFRRER